MNLYILSEKRPKSEVIHEILKIYSELTSNVVHVNTNIEIIPVINDKQHDFTYDVKGVEVEGINEIKLFIASGHSSFVDFLVFEQEEKPLENGDNNLLFLVEETKTSDQEYRNVSAYQRHAKFIYADYHYPNTPKFMLYNKENNHDKKPSNTNKLGTNLLLTQNIKIIGKDLTHFKKFESIDELIDFKNKMKGRKGNVAIQITKFEDRIEVSGRLSKPANAGNIGHDPNIGSLTSISKTLRVLE